MTELYTSLPHIRIDEQQRIPTRIPSFDELLGGGFYPGETILLAGEPGSGKSTMLLQIAARLATQGKRILYVCGEESLSQVASRAERLDARIETIYCTETTTIEKLYEMDKTVNSDFIIIDSLQMVQSLTMMKPPANPTQMRYCLSSLISYAKGHNKTLITIGHSTKTGLIAGLLTLQHMVDAVFFISNMDGERIIYAKKNRFGRTQETMPITMTEHGFREFSMSYRPMGFTDIDLWEIPMLGIYFIGEICKAMVVFVFTFVWEFTKAILGGSKKKS